MISPIESNNIMDHSYISHQVACLETSHQTRIESTEQRNHLTAKSSHHLLLSPIPKMGTPLFGEW